MLDFAVKSSKIPPKKISGASRRKIHEIPARAHRRKPKNANLPKMHSRLRRQINKNAKNANAFLDPCFTALHFTQRWRFILSPGGAGLDLVLQPGKHPGCCCCEAAGVHHGGWEGG